MDRRSGRARLAAGRRARGLPPVGLGPGRGRALVGHRRGHRRHRRSPACTRPTPTSVGDDALLDARRRLLGVALRPAGDRLPADQGLTDEPSIAVVVQQLVASERSGVMFTADPSTGDRDHVVIEAAFGLGEVVVGGQVEPDTYVARQGRSPPAPGPHRPQGATGCTPTATAASNASRPPSSDAPPPGAHRRRGRRPGRARASRSRPTTATAPGHRVGHRRRHDLPRAGPAHHHPRRGRGPKPPRPRPAATVLLRGLAASPGSASGRVRVLRSPGRGRPAPGRRGARRAA